MPLMPCDIVLGEWLTAASREGESNPSLIQFGLRCIRLHELESLVIAGYMVVVSLVCATARHTMELAMPEVALPPTARGVRRSAGLVDPAKANALEGGWITSSKIELRRASTQCPVRTGAGV